MSKNVRKPVSAKANPPVPAQRVVPLAEIPVETQQALHELVVDSGMKVLAALLEEDRVSLCGPRHQPDAERQAYRHGHDQGRLVLGGRKVSVRKPRVRDVAGQEVTLPSWQQLSAEDPLRRRVVEQISVGVSTRKYERSLEDLPPGVEPSCAKKSSVSRRFVVKSAEQVRTFLARPLEELDLPVLMIDGTHLGEFLLLVALGIDREGHKHVLGIWAGSTESAEVCRSLLRQLLGRGLKVERSALPPGGHRRQQGPA